VYIPSILVKSSNAIMLDQVRIKIYKLFRCLTSLIRFVIKYIFIAYSFSVTNIDFSL
jgi:hypothetical protein